MIGPDILEEAGRLVASTGTGEAAIVELRRRWPDLRFTACSDDDVPPRLAPALEGAGFKLYLVGGGEHCLALCSDPEQAIGLVVAEAMSED